MPKLAKRLLMIVALISLVLTCNTFNREESKLLRYDDHQSEAELKVTSIYKDTNIEIKAQGKRVHNKIIYHNLKLLAEDKLLLGDTNRVFTLKEGLFPIVRILKLEESNKKITEVLIPWMDKSHFQRIARWEIDATGSVKEETLPYFSTGHGDWDNDGNIEFGGFPEPIISYCSECDSSFYQPMWFYEMNNSGFKFDTLATKEWILGRYDTFIGFEADTLQLFKKPKMKDRNLTDRVL